MRSEFSFPIREFNSSTVTRCLKLISPKTGQSMLAALALLAITGSAQAENEMATVIRSSPIYDPSSYYLECRSTFNGEQRCERVARPDKPFPLPIGFVTTVKLTDGSIETTNTRNRYSPGNRVKVEYDVRQ